MPRQSSFAHRRSPGVCCNADTDSAILNTGAVWWLSNGERSHGPINNEDHWRERAKEARALAEKMDDAQTKRTMLDIAESYDRLADRAKQRKAKQEGDP